MMSQRAPSKGLTCTKASFYYSKFADIAEKAKASGISEKEIGAAYDEALKAADRAITRSSDDTKQELAEMILWDKLCEFTCISRVQIQSLLSISPDWRGV
jgi:hypothetical protein